MKNVYRIQDSEVHYISSESENHAIYDLCKSVYGYDDVFRYKYENEPEITVLDPDYNISYYDEVSEKDVTHTCKELAISISGVICSTIW